MNCPRCQREVEDGQLYCSSCGLSLAADTKETELLPALDNSFKTVASDPLIGRVLDAKYELLAPLGAGGMGTVYRARRVHIGDEVAVKVLSPQYVSSRESVERFRREARAAALLRHPNVVTIHDFGEPRVVAARLAEVVDRDDVWMPQQGSRARLTTKPFDRFAAAHVLRRQDLDRHFVADVDAPRAIDRAHAARAERRKKFILRVEHAPDERI